MATAAVTKRARSAMCRRRPELTIAITMTVAALGARVPRRRATGHGLQANDIWTELAAHRCPHG